jgi:Lipase (class 3)
MNLERLPVEESTPPFPIHQDPVAALLQAHRGDTEGRDATVAHLLGVCSAYAYADTPTVATMLSRLGLAGGACVRIEQAIDAMFVFSTAFVAQSRCGRVVVLAYRGTEPTNLASWLGDADIGPEQTLLGDERLVVHAGFVRNMRATRWGVLAELRSALAGRSLLDPERATEHPLEALYITGHSLGGAMAALFALSLSARSEAALVEKLRAIYTFGQPLALAASPAAAVQRVGRRFFRHLLVRDPIPALPAAPWGRLAHFGREYRCDAGVWRESSEPVAQLEKVRDISRSLLAVFATAKRKHSARLSLAVHPPHHYLDALRPSGCVTEFGDPT